MPKLPMKAISILSISSLVFFISLPTNAMHPINHGFQGAKPNCTYSIEIETTCAQSAETTDHVSVRFSDSKGDLIIVKHLKNPKLLYAPKGGSKRGGYGGFGRCAIDMFEASGPCMSSRVCSLYVKKVGSDDWRPGWVKVLHRQDGGQVPVSYVFYFRTFVPENVWYGFDYCHSKGGFVPHVVSFDD
ncbi:embryo-specific protein ATS3A [Rosa sericea]